jgi:DNA-binding MarR family transcriptional regulator
MRRVNPIRAGKLGPLEAYVGYALRRAQVAIFGDFIATLGELKLRPAQFSVLALIDANPAIVQARVGETLGIQKANLVPLLSRLEKRKLLRRVPLDGRSNGLHLTPEGRTLLQRARRLNDVTNARATRALSDAERERLIDMLWRIAEFDAPAAASRAPKAAQRSPSKSAASPRRGSAARRSRAASDPA